MKTLGEIAYTAYCENVEWKSFGGQKLPAWDDQNPRLRHAWEIAALAVSESVLKEHEQGNR